MKKLMIKNLGKQFLRPFIALSGWAKRKLSPQLKVRLTRQSIMISLPANQGGRLHILPLPRPGGASGLTRTFEVIPVDGGKYALKASPDSLVLASYPSEVEAARALFTLNKALTGNLVLKWGFRLFLVWLAWLFITSYMEVSQHTNSSKPDILGLAQGAIPNIPSEPAPFQTTPSVNGQGGGDLSNYIYQQAMLAKDKAQKDLLPPKVGVDNAAGLATFGLKGADGSGEGCDPKLAFKAPQK